MWCFCGFVVLKEFSFKTTELQELNAPGMKANKLFSQNVTFSFRALRDSLLYPPFQLPVCLSVCVFQVTTLR